MTGRLPKRSGTTFVPLPGQGDYGLSPWEYTLAELFSDVGYATALYGKWHLGDVDGRLDPMQLAERDHEHADHDHTFSTWSFETKRPLSLAALNEMIKKQLPGNIYRCKGVVYTAENRERRAVLQVVGRRADVALGKPWGETKPRTQTVAIDAPGSID